MLQSTTGDNGGAGREGAFRNGSNYGGFSGGGHVTSRRPGKGSSRRFRDEDGGSNPRVSQQQQQQQQDKEGLVRPCTDFDVAYFNSYAHLGIHEEMIKVQLFATPLMCSCIFSWIIGGLECMRLSSFELVE